MLDLLHTNGVVSCLLDFLDELLLFFSKVVDTRDHLFFVLFGLSVLLTSGSFWALSSFERIGALLIG